MCAKRLASAVAIGLLGCVLVVHAQGQQNQSDKLPRTFTGIWEWQGGRHPRSRVTLAIDKAVEKDGIITFTGSQTYHIYDLKEKVTGRIDHCKTGKITLHGFQNRPKAAVTDGKFEGTISKPNWTPSPVSGWTRTLVPKGEELEIDSAGAVTGAPRMRQQGLPLLYGFAGSLIESGKVARCSVSSTAVAPPSPSRRSA